ncbi:RIP metalloprotease RseP [Mesonia sp. MT50]|uniref:Zinc metalloprotease n=1 Tax=Mesonia profundi TaxID=3070998 RepID=A0ABU0ZYQ1_9FLAO|nr:RIP metalloprotease RseP [Mesonia profundi]MDQ7916592.1 RIP metalloprotease RseP [Mesonia profundi]
MSPFAIKAIQLLLSLSFLIVLHELGHFIPAKLFKTRVEKFYLFFDVKFSLLKKKIGDTEYGIGWLPLGGYVKISGMIDESMDKEQMAQPPQPWEFRSKPAWQRLIIMLGGVTVNVLLGFFIYMMVLFVWGSDFVTKDDIPDGFAVAEPLHEYGFEDGDRILEVNGEAFENQVAISQHFMVRSVETVKVLHQDGSEEELSVPEDIGLQLFKAGHMKPFSRMASTTIDSVTENSIAQQIDLRKGDEVIAFNEQPLTKWHEFQKKKADLESLSGTLTVMRDGSKMEIPFTLDDEKQFGVYPKGKPINIQTREYSLGESISKGFDYGYWTLHDYAAQFKYVFTKKGATQVGGFGAIGNLFPDAWDWRAFWGTTALISMILAFMNILPIPALDGGHVMFLLYEIISGRKPNDKFMEYAQVVGFFILIALVLFANGNDVYRWLFE